MQMDARVFIDLDALSRGALEELRRVMREALQARGRFAAALAGGGFTAFETGRGGPRCVAVSRFSGLSQKRSGVMAVGAPAKPLQRLTLTPVFVNRGRHGFFRVAGGNKREIMDALRAEPAGEPRQYPAGTIQPEGHSLWFFVKAAEA